MQLSQLAIDFSASHPKAHLQALASLLHPDEDTWVLSTPEDLPDLCRFLRATFPYLMDVCGVDYLHLLPQRVARFDVVYHFAYPEQQRRLRVKVPLKEGQTIPSATEVYKSALWFEREVYDLFGVVFTSHPQMRRILCHEDFVGHALRKDYPADKRQPLRRSLEHVFEQDRERLMSETKGDFLSEKLWINIGPAHPATHGTLRFMAVLDGERIQKVDVEIGYLHRCFEKMAETHSYNQIIPYTDRLNYCSAPLNNNAWCRSVEKLMQVTPPPRAQVIRIMLDEFSRCIDHFVCIITQALDLGGFTNFWLGMRAREAVYNLFEKLCGARLTVSLARVGGLGFDLPEGWLVLAEDACRVILEAHHEVHTLCTENRIFVSRMVGVTPITPEDAIQWGFTGPCLRAAGVPMDLRKSQPYGGYEPFDFDIPIGSTGDCYDRYMVRMEEIRQSVRIIRQAIRHMPSGPVKSDNPLVSLPDKKDVYGNIEGLMHQFMGVIHDVQPPPGEVYCANEGANGELGFYIISDGSGRPYRVKCRPPCFAIFQAMPHMLEGHLLSDAIAALGTLNIVAGELDR